MEELTGPKVQVVLSLREGNGFNRLDNPVIIVATLNGHVLETDSVDPDLNPRYITDLVWDVDKIGVRKMRVGHVPLKVECFTVDDNGKREKIGYVLLPLRSAQIIPRGKERNIKVTWHKLLGVKPELRVSGPELLLSLTVEERDMLTGSGNCNVEQRTELDTESAFSTAVTTPRLLHDERLIQLGPDSTCQDLFLLSITASKAENLEYLVRKDRDELRENFCFLYQIMDNDIRLKSFKQVPDKPQTMNEKIVIRIRSSLSVLKNYFQDNPYLLVKLQYGGVLVGQSKIDIRPIVPNENVVDFFNDSNDTTMALDQQCFLSMDAADETAAQGKDPSIDIQLRLRYVGSKNTNSKNNGKSQNLSLTDNKENDDTSSKLPVNNWGQLPDCNVENNRRTCHSIDQKRSEIDAHRNPGGDFGKCVGGLEQNLLGLKNPNKHYSSSCEAIKQQSADPMFSHSAYAILHSSTDKECRRSVDAYHCYCLSISLESVEFSRELNMRNINFR